MDKYITPAVQPWVLSNLSANIFFFSFHNLSYHQMSNRPLESSQAAGRSRTSRAANTFAALLIVEMLMNCIFNQINSSFHNYLALYIGDNDNNTNIQGQIIMKGTVNLVKDAVH